MRGAPGSHPGAICAGLRAAQGLQGHSCSGAAKPRLEALTRRRCLLAEAAQR